MARVTNENLKTLVDIMNAETGLNLQLDFDYGQPALRSPDMRLIVARCPRPEMIAKLLAMVSLSLELNKGTR